MLWRATRTSMHELSAGVLEEKNRNPTSADWYEPKEPQQLELKPLPVELKYAFLEENGQCLVVISSLLTTSQEHNLLDLLKRNKQALRWKISDLKGINPTICTHHIYLERLLGSHRGG